MSKQKKYILIGTLPPPYDGQSVAFKILADAFAQQNGIFKTINISSFNTKNKNRLIYLPYRIGEYLLVLLQLSLCLLSNYRNVYLQISQSRRGFLRDSIIINFAKFFNCSIIVHLHGGNYDNFYQTLSPYIKNKVKKTLAKVDLIIVLSKNFVGMFDFNPALKNKIISIANGTGSRIDSVTGKSIKHSSPVKILYLSNLIETKGYLYVLEAANILFNKYHLNIEVAFCGNFIVNNDKSSFASVNDAKNHFFNTIKKYNLDKVVSYKGVVANGAKQMLLDEANFFVLPTQYINEGQPISIIEAMRAGCVVITTRYRAMPEMITNGIDGYLLNTITATEIAKLIYETSNNQSKFKEISINAINTYNLKFTGDSHCNNLINEIKSQSY